MPDLRWPGLAAVAWTLALAALFSLHEELRPVQATLVASLTFAVALLLRTAWTDLPRFVTAWLDAGGVLVTVLFVAGATAFAQGLPYAVLRAPSAAPLFVAASLLAFLLAGLVWTHRRLDRHVRSTTERLVEARQRALESQLAALSAQINPHFLFNTLNTLAEVVHEDPDDAEAMITDLATMMRYALEATTERVPLAREIDVVRRVLRLEQERLGARLSVAVHLDPACAEARIPGLLVQPLVENAVQHGVAEQLDGGHVTVRAERSGERVHIEVTDDGPGLPDAVLAALAAPLATASHPGGLRNAMERARLAWPDADVRIDSSPSGTTITLDLPLETP